MDTNDGGDYIVVYDGNTTGSPYLGSLSYSSNNKGAINVVLGRLSRHQPMARLNPTKYLLSESVLCCFRKLAWVLTSSWPWHDYRRTGSVNSFIRILQSVHAGEIQLKCPVRQRWICCGDIAIRVHVVLAVVDTDADTVNDCFAVNDARHGRPYYVVAEFHGP